MTTGNDTQAIESATLLSSADSSKKGFPPVLEQLAAEALRLKASDIFISANFPPSLKIDGKLQPAPLKPLSEEQAESMVLATMNAGQRETFVRELDLDYAVQAKSGVRFRVNAYHEQGRVGMVMRRLNEDIPSVEELKLPVSLKDLALRRRGLVILSGAIGSGKSTTMASMLDWRNRNSYGHIVTIEDPIEYVHKPQKCIITHREIGTDTLNWERAVQSALREAPDVVCIGEVRSDISMEYALRLAQTGHLCFLTVHANNAEQAIERILNFFPQERHRQILIDLSLNLVAIVSQRLVLKKDHKGRRAAADLLINTPAMQDYIFNGEITEIKPLMKRSESEGMSTIDDALFKLYCEGVIDYGEALRQADSGNDLQLRIRLYEDGQDATAGKKRVEDLNLL